MIWQGDIWNGAQGPDCLLKNYDLPTVGLFYKIIIEALHLNRFFFAWGKHPWAACLIQLSLLIYDFFIPLLCVLSFSTYWCITISWAMPTECIKLGFKLLDKCWFDPRIFGWNACHIKTICIFSRCQKKICYCGSWSLASSTHILFL